MELNDPKTVDAPIRFIDLFCGIGGFRLALEDAAQRLSLETRCAFSSDIDPACQQAYATYFGDLPLGDISEIDTDEIPTHDCLLAGFPCQPFSIIGAGKGFADTRGTLFFEIARILDAKKPSLFILENVKRLVGHNQGKTLRKILATLEEIGYRPQYKVLNALDFGLPQKRERVFIVGLMDRAANFHWPEGGFPMKPLQDLLETDPPLSCYASDYIRKKRLSVRKPTAEPTIWHENKSGNVSAYPYSCALRAGASYNYLLVNGERRLTSREMLRLQGFPDAYPLVCHDSQTRKQAGNSLPVNVAREVAHQALLAAGFGEAPT